MAPRGRWRSWVRTTAVAALLGGALAGCSSKDSSTQVEAKPGDGTSPAASINGVGQAMPMGGGSETKGDRLHQPFAEACTVEINADSGVALPPTVTLNEKNSGQLNEEIQHLWDTIKFTADGKRQTY